MLRLVPLIFWLLLPGGAVLPQAAPPPFVGRCLPQLRQTALTDGAPLPTDSASSKAADYGTCSARCDSRCFLAGDFDGDGRPRELAVATPTELLLFSDVERGKNRRYQAQPAGRLPLTGDEVALVSLRRATRFADEVGLLRDGRSPLPQLPKNERLAFGLIIWRSAGAPDAEEEPDHAQSGEAGELLLAIYDEQSRTYRLHRVLQLGGNMP